MARFDVSTTIKRPVEDVFAVMSNVENNPKWSSVALEAEQTSPGPIGVGTTARVVAKVLGRRMESDFEVTEFEPNRKFVSQSKSGPFPLQLSVTFEPIEGGTRVNTTIEGEPGGFFKLAEPLVQRAIKREMEANFATLKDILEAGSS